MPGGPRSSSPVSRAAKLLDEDPEVWRTRPIAEVRYLFLDARHEKVRHSGVMRDAAVLSAIGIGPDEPRRILGVSAVLVEIDEQWQVDTRGDIKWECRDDACTDDEIASYSGQTSKATLIRYAGKARQIMRARQLLQSASDD